MYNGKKLPYWTTKLYVSTVTFSRCFGVVVVAKNIAAKMTVFPLVSASATY